MIHPHTTLRWISDEVGFGVFATQLIPRGTITWVLDHLDQRISPAQRAELGAVYEPFLARYGYQDASGHTVLSWDHARFVNHSCDPNCVSGGDDGFEVALRDIQPGEQLCDDYGELISPDRFACRCGSERCRGQLRMRSSAQDTAGLDQARVEEALRWIGQVEQPLAAVAALCSPRLASLLQLAPTVR